jgi:hypothetical protein
MKKIIFIFGIILLSFFTASICSQTNNTELKRKYSASEGFVTHEWGTFTTLQKSNGELLSGLEKEEERLPKFVFNLSFEWTLQSISKGYQKYYDLKNVKVKMETPVLYFYSPESVEKNIFVDIGFQNGSISQWYPNRTDGEFIPHVVIREGGSLPHPNIDFALPRKGKIYWDATILPKTDNSAYTNDILQETQTWKAQEQPKVIL